MLKTDLWSVRGRVNVVPVRHATPPACVRLRLRERHDAAGVRRQAVRVPFVFHVAVPLCHRVAAAERGTRVVSLQPLERSVGRGVMDDHVRVEHDHDGVLVLAVGLRSRGEPVKDGRRAVVGVVRVAGHVVARPRGRHMRRHQPNIARGGLPRGDGIA